MLLLDTTAQTVLFYMACISTTFFTFKIVLMLIMGNFLEVDFISFEADAGDSNDDFGVISINSVVCFFVGFSWVSLASLRDWGFTIYPSLGFGLLAGLLSSGLLVFLLSLARKLDNVPKNVILKAGSEGIVYNKIPEKGIGKVRIDNKIILATSSEPLSSFTRIKLLEDIEVNTNQIASVASIN